ASTSASATLTRRKSTSSLAAAPGERRPQKRATRTTVNPENAFILFRRKCCEDRASLPPPHPHPHPHPPHVRPLLRRLARPDGKRRPTGKKQRQADLRKTISLQWKA
ncbi:hypothetical protein B0H11DRAFT_1624633, partial [Mycena galericulata]